MSRISFKTDKYEVISGWDNPLQGYHMTIIDITNQDEEDWDETEHIVYDNIYESLNFPRSTNMYEQKLQEMGIEAPEGFWEEAKKKLGNHFRAF